MKDIQVKGKVFEVNKQNVLRVPCTTQDNSAARLEVDLNPELLSDLQSLATMTSKQDHVYGKGDILY